MKLEVPYTKIFIVPDSKVHFDMQSNLTMVKDFNIKNHISYKVQIYKSTDNEYYLTDETGRIKYLFKLDIELIDELLSNKIHHRVFYKSLEKYGNFIKLDSEKNLIMSIKIDEFPRTIIPFQILSAFYDSSYSCLNDVDLTEANELRLDALMDYLDNHYLNDDPNNISPYLAPEEKSFMNALKRDIKLESIE